MEHEIALEANLPQAKRAPQSRDIVAAMVGVSARSVQDCERIKKASPEKAELIAAGELTINRALAECRAEGLIPYTPKQLMEMNNPLTVGEVRLALQDYVDDVPVASIKDAGTRLLAALQRL